MMDTLKEKKNRLMADRLTWKEFCGDCRQYIRWNYHNPRVKTKNALEAKILRQGHVIEKGMSLSNPREKFGVRKAEELLDFVREFEEAGYCVENSTAVKNVLMIVKEYLAYHKARGFIPESVDKAFRKYVPMLEDRDPAGGIHTITKEELMAQAHGNFEKFFRSRHSVRQYAPEPVKPEDIRKAVSLAMRAPSACNRQSCSVYFYQDPETNRALGEKIAGNTGFQQEVQNYLVVTSDMSAFYDSFERNQTYVDGGIFALALTEALHYYGMASCILQNGEFRFRDREFRQICGNIPENEKIILFIAVGYYKESFQYAVSTRKALEDVLKIR